MNRKRQKGYSLVALVEDDGDLDDPRQQVEMTVFDETIDLDRGGKPCARASPGVCWLYVSRWRTLLRPCKWQFERAVFCVSATTQIF